MEIGKRIKQLREDRNFTQEYLAKSINSTKQAIFKYENGVVTNIPMDKLMTISSVLGCSPAYLMGWEGNQNNGINNGIIGDQNHNNVITLDPKRVLNPIDSAILTICESLNEKQKGAVLTFATQLLSKKESV